MNYYNEFDPKAAAWLRELIRCGHLPGGDVDTRSIVEVAASDLAGYTQCHFFAGIGGWPLALDLAGWPRTRPVWTGSCPCQPFSSAGKHLGDKDERHLWPAFHNLIRECRPEHVFGEQVASAIGKGWLDGVSSDLEGSGYACGAAVLGAHSVGAPHLRQRLYWAARFGNFGGWRPVVFSSDTDEDGNCPLCRVDYAGCQCPGPTQDDTYEYQERDGVLWARPLADANGGQPWSARAGRPQPGGEHGQQPEARGARRLGDSVEPGLEGHAGHGYDGHQPGRKQPDAARSAPAAGDACPWARYQPVFCTDGKSRRTPVEPGFQPLAHGVSGRVGLLRGYGNAIVPQVAAEFVAAYLDVTETL